MNSMCVVELHVTVKYINILLHNNTFMANLCHRQQCKIYVRVFERNYILANLHSFHTLRINAVLKQNNIYFLMAFFKGTIWRNIS
jgi:hypothetical protein